MAHHTRVALVTGANKGIGYEVCRQLLEKHYHVIMTARDQARGEQAYDKLAAHLPEPNKQLDFCKLDVTSDKQVEEVFKHVRKKHKRCDVLINNAGIFPDPRDDLEHHWPSILTANIDDIKRGMDTNAYGTLRMCQAFIPLMQEHDYGRVVNLASGMAQLSDMNGCCPGYRISKTAINVITRVLADELKGANILINSMCPGWVKTDMGGPGATRELPDGADTAVWLASLPNDGASGQFFRDREPIPW